jgi:hypothetical protein
MWRAEAIPDNGGSYTVIVYKDRRATCKALGNHLRWLAQSQRISAKPGQRGLYMAAGDLFSAAATCSPQVMPVLRIGTTLYQVVQEDDATPAS